MRAVLMAAGRGTRISRHIDDSCKCTLDIGGITLIRNTVDMLLEHGVDVNIVVGHKKESVRHALNRLPVRFFTNPFYDVTNSIASLWFARELLDGCEDLLLVNADVFWQEDVLKSIIGDERDIIMLGDSSRHISEKGDYFFKSVGDRLVKHGKKMQNGDITAEYVGIACARSSFQPAMLERLEQLVNNGSHHMWWEDVLYSYIHEREIWVKDISGCFWMEIDFIEDYERILRYRRGMDPFSE